MGFSCSSHGAQIAYILTHMPAYYTAQQFTLANQCSTTSIFLCLQPPPCSPRIFHTLRNHERLLIFSAKLWHATVRLVKTYRCKSLFTQLDVKAKPPMPECWLYSLHSCLDVMCLTQSNMISFLC